MEFWWWCVDICKVNKRTSGLPVGSFHPLCAKWWSFFVPFSPLSKW